MQLRLGLIPPAIVIGVNAWLAEWYWGLAIGVAVILVGWQLYLRSQDVKQAAREMQRLLGRWTSTKRMTCQCTRRRRPRAHASDRASVRPAARRPGQTVIALADALTPVRDAV